ncbi:hypothetical protein ENSA7_25150 [Enhygromyxa salina]|uniref:Uncharacterized protein n=1 Tax=Enhygromyxa salina TaxID=215803 RepID=A0A2S9YRM1_9BACT|nr:hypothetical protein ENSA7_25150 [Enhygromyxa salina]
MEDRPDRVDVDGRLARAAAQLLGRHVAKLALHVQARGLLAGEPRDAEVGELDLARDRHEHVVRRHVAVDDRGLGAVVVEPVGIRERAQDLADHVRRDLDRHPLAVREHLAGELRQVETVDPLHDHEALAVDLTNVEHLNDVGVGQQHRQPRLLDEHVAVGGVVEQVPGEQLDSDGLARACHGGATAHPDLRHAAAADLAQQLVVAQAPHRTEGSRSELGDVNRSRADRRADRWADRQPDRRARNRPILGPTPHRGRWRA